MARVMQQEEDEEEEIIVHVGSLFYLTNTKCRFLLARSSYYSRPLSSRREIPAYEINQQPLRYIRLDGI